MDFRRFDNTYYVRIDKGEEVISELIKVCESEGIDSAIFTGIGGCSHAEIQMFIPEKGEFETEEYDGMLELVNITGNITIDNGTPLYHVHASFSFKEGKEHRMAAGHLKSTVVLYTAEIELRPVTGGIIKRKHDPETKTAFWCFE